MPTHLSHLQAAQANTITKACKRVCLSTAQSQAIALLVFTYGKSLLPRYFCVNAECIGSEVRITVACKPLGASVLDDKPIINKQKNSNKK